LRASSNLCIALLFLFLSSVPVSRIAAQTATESVIAENGSSSGNSSSSSSLATPDSGDMPAIQTDAGPKLPQPGQLGSPFQVDHFWKRIGLEIAGGYSPILGRGTGYYGPGFSGTLGARDRLTPHWSLLGEGQILGQHGNLSHAEYDPTGNFVDADVASYIVAFHLDPVYYLRPDAVTAPYLVGGVGYYRLGTHSFCNHLLSSCSSSSDDPFVTGVAAVNAAGFNVGVGIRHRLYVDRHTEIFADARYHYIASGSSVVGQISVLPVSAGIRW
jgi:hypothetical protein